MSLDTESTAFWDPSDVEGELKRVFDICNGCRRCYNLCPSFNDLFERLDRDEVDGDAEKLNSADLKSVTDLCYQCKLCFNHCPYTPPHRWEIDFPRLMLRSRAIQTKREGQSLQDRFLGQVDAIGRLGSLFAPVMNWLNRNSLNRWLMEKTIGIHRSRILPNYASETFRQWFDKRASNKAFAAGKKLVLFYTCSVNFNEPQAIKDDSSHPTADQVYDKVRERLPNVSLGTVYRNLQKLVADEKLQILMLGARNISIPSSGAISISSVKNAAGCSMF